MNYNPELTKYAKQLAIRYEEYKKYQYSGKNGADSDNEKGFWRGMAEGKAPVTPGAALHRVAAGA